ncbi:cation transporter [Acidaminobacter sp. JC074]|uniref:cation diffusion facilitator family transporter n=1 Tax=Acidaminobacter sp. JC074 TaxID=2530199 RepID=UPI001F0D4D43|nr:cation diffusion facilitator family transporter [Acidaminobacter sp. JC074]MCH4888673.1 cation transporter [Acidaminobacter sp. JC074]
MDRVQIAKRVSIITVVWNTILSVIKIVIGFFGHSSAIVADGIHSMSDVFTTVIAYVGVNMSAKKADDDHQYGHEKFEPVMSKILATVLIVTALMIGYSGIKNIFNPNLETPSQLNLLAAGLSIVVKEWMYRYTKKAADKINSSALKADAWHHRTDAFSSIGSLIGVGGALLGFKFFDPLAAVVIAVIIIKVGVEIYLKSIDEVMDKSADEETIQKIRTAVQSVDGVVAIDMLLTRQHASVIYVDLEIGVNGDLTLWKAHAIAEKVHLVVEDEVPLVKHCMVHVNPY